MSGFLSSVLSSIGGNEQPAQGSLTTSVTITPSKTAQQQRKGTSVAANASQVTASAAISLKRKAEVNSPGGPVKEPRLEQPSTTKHSQSRAPPETPPTGLTGQSQSAVRSDQLPYRGTARPTPPMSVPKAPANPAAAGTSPSPAAPPLKKGTYQEVLARAKAAQQTAQVIGTIKHKPVEKISKRERERREAEASAKAKQAAARGPQNGKINGSATSAKPTEQVKERKKPVELSYKGTMRPANCLPPLTYKGNMLLSSAPRPAPLHKPASRHPERSRSTPLPRRTREPNVRYAGYASYSEHESEEEEEEADDMGSETSDMEATGFDIEEEEMKSLKVARKEDEEAAREEDELKRQKAEKKRKLQQLAANAKPRKF